MVVDRRWRQALRDQRSLPGDDVALEAGRDAIVAVARHEEADEAVEVQGDLLGHLRGADPDDGQRETSGAYDVW